MVMGFDTSLTRAYDAQKLGWKYEALACGVGTVPYIDCDPAAPEAEPPLTLLLTQLYNNFGLSWNQDLPPMTNEQAEQRLVVPPRGVVQPDEDGGPDETGDGRVRGHARPHGQVGQAEELEERPGEQPPRGVPQAPADDRPADQRLREQQLPHRRLVQPEDPDEQGGVGGRRDGRSGRAQTRHH